jgi:hypothetical protein
MFSKSVTGTLQWHPDAELLLQFDGEPFTWCEARELGVERSTLSKLSHIGLLEQTSEQDGRKQLWVVSGQVEEYYAEK